MGCSASQISMTPPTHATHTQFEFEKRFVKSFVQNGLCLHKDFLFNRFWRYLKCVSGNTRLLSNPCVCVSGDADSESAALGYFVTPCVGTLVTLLSYLLLPRLVSHPSLLPHDPQQYHGSCGHWKPGGNHGIVIVYKTFGGNVTEFWYGI